MRQSGTAAWAERAAIGLLMIGGVFAVGSCSERRPNGATCIKDRDCESELCRSGTCVAEPPAGPTTFTSSTTGGLGGTAGTGGTGGAGAAGGMGGAGGAGGNMGGGGG